eukprot:TRINITY_DN392_c0_g1_i2.p1 TRINITY_DN392_c0_g1~~TRINITY_DN392_c0_g1_i2.p1  ORF type:complete len:141 (+),score=36.79 TRINITY_DN392_c0_g1_i2:63-485(+)
MQHQISLDADFFDDTELIEAWDEANSAKVDQPNHSPEPQHFNPPLSAFQPQGPFPPFPSGPFPPGAVPSAPYPNGPLPSPSGPPGFPSQNPADVAFSNMLLSWYYAGYYTGQYQTLLATQQQQSSSSDSSSSQSSGASDT